MASELPAQFGLPGCRLDSGDIMRNGLQKALLIAEAAVLFAGGMFYLAISGVSRAIWMRARSV